MKRQYFHRIKFGLDGIEDKVPNTNWVITNTPKQSGEQGLIFTKDSVISNPHLTSPKCMSVQNQYSYYKDETEYSADDTHKLSVALFFRIDSTCMTNFLIDNNHYMSGVEWDDENGNHISLRIAAHDQYRQNQCVSVNINNRQQLIEASYDYTENTWQHILLSKDDEFLYLFLDGRLKVKIYSKDLKIGWHFKNICVGNQASSLESGDVKYDLDEIYIVNDTLYKEDFKISYTRNFDDLFPEIEYDDTEKESDKTNLVPGGAPGYYGANKSRWDNVLDDVEITRPVYYEEEMDAKIKHMDKHEFYKDNKSSLQNFKHFDRTKHWDIGN